MAKTAKITSKNNDAKLRHLTGAYLHLNDSPTDADILYFLSIQKGKASTTEAIIKAFGTHKADRVEAILRSLIIKMLASKSMVGDQIIISLI